MTNTIGRLSYKCLALILYVVPLATLFAVNFTAYVDTSPGVTISFFGYILLALIIFGTKNKLGLFAKNNTMLAVCLVIFITALIMRYLANELLLISGAGLLGCLLSILPDRVADEYSKERGKVPLGHRDAWMRSFGYPPRVGEYE